MRLRVWDILLSVWLVAAGYGPVRAQTGSLLGTSQVPANPAHDQAVKPHSAAPKMSGQKPDSAKSENPPTAHPPTAHSPVAHPSGAHPPVVAAHGPTHPQKPAAVAKPSPPVPSPAPTGPSSEAVPEAKLPEKLPEPEKPEGAPARLPRFVSLRSDDVNMRAGPGTRYPIEWVYKRRDLPVEIEREFDVWRWVRDPEGIQGWVHQATLIGRRNFIVQKADATLRSDPADSAAAVAILKPGVIGRIRACDAKSEWCSVQTGSYRGYLRRTQFWGLLPGEAINP
jgi:SH3-like domain-containing protein